MELNSEFTPQFLKEYQKLISESLKPVTEITRSFTVLQEKLSPFYTSQMQDLAKLYNSNIAASMSAIVNKLCYCKTLDNQAILRNFSANIQEAFQDIDFQKSLSEGFSNIDKSDFQCFSEPTEDYVTLDESNANEWNIPETIAIPIGNSRVRMKTSDFIQFLAIIVTTLTFIVSFVFERLDSAADAETTQQLIELEQERNEIEKERNQILYEFLSSIDTSESSQAETIEELKESVSTHYSDFPDFQESPSTQTADSLIQDSASQVPEANHGNCPETESSNLE